VAQLYGLQSAYPSYSHHPVGHAFLRVPSDGWHLTVVRPPMHRILIALFLASGATFSTAQTSPHLQNAVLAAVHQFIGGFNKGDANAIRAACAEETSILDDFPPHEWHGTGACSKWFSDFQSMA
jgi:hypothetical protein